MATFLRLAAASALLCLAACGAPRPPVQHPEDAVAALVARHHVTGLAVAVVRGGQVVSTRAYGLRDRESGAPLATDTTMYAASLTKGTFAWLVTELAAEGKVDLDRAFVELVPDLPTVERWTDLAADPRWQRLTLRILLAHTSGFASYRGIEPDGKLHFHREPGARFGYSNDGINLAQVVLERAYGIDVRAEMQRRIFDRYAMTRTSLVWRDDLAPNVATGYDRQGKRIEHERRKSVRAAGSMDTTLDDWSRFFAAVLRTPSAGRALMLAPQIAIDSPRQFPTLLEERTDRWQGIGLAYGLGWGLFRTPRGPAFFKEGHDDGTSNYAIGLVDSGDGVVMLSNDNRAEEIFATIAEVYLGPTNLPAEWEGYAPPEAAGR